MSKVKQVLFSTETLSLVECTDGFWLYDKLRGMNLAMRAETANDAFLKAMEYYQKRLKGVEDSYMQLSMKVDRFVSSVRDGDDE